MGTCFLYGNGGGGTKLPFRIFYGTTQPSNPKNCDIWIKTSVTVTQVDFVNGTWSAAVGRTIIMGSPSGESPSASNALTYVVSDKTNGIPTYGKLKLTGCLQVQGNAGNWVSLDAYKYYGGTWVQFSSAFSATINVTYPAGSTCTAKCGSYTNTAPNTTGKWACVVPCSGTWTISCTNGTKTATNTVSISTNGESKSLTLVYEVYLYKQGDECTSLTGGWTATATKPSGSGSTAVTPGVTKSSDSITVSLYSGYDQYRIGYLTSGKKIDLTKYSKITINLTAFAINGEILVSTSKTSGFTMAASKRLAKGSNVLDISSLSGSYYILLGMGGHEGTASFTFNEVWLE